MDSTRPVFSIAEYIVLINEQLKLYQASIQGEVTEVKVWSSGHVYFTLKDKHDNAVLDCVMWKGLYQMYGIKIEVGMELIATGNANVYAPSGRLSFVASSIELVGEGQLKKAYDQLKQKLTAEGIFAEERKRKLPKFPRKIGVITSRHGAVIHDFMNNLSKHGLKITFINSRVEGQESLHDILLALRTMKLQEVDVIVLMRGGGSLQSLAAFDAEVLIRELVTSPVPVIAAIGHHQDVPLCALAADAMVSTPTAAANLLCSDWEKGLLAVYQNYQKIVLAYTHLLNDVSMTVQLRQVKIIEKFDRILSVFDYTKEHMTEYISKVSNALNQYSATFTRHTQHIMSHMGDAISNQRTQLDILRNEKINRSFSFSLKTIHEQIVTKEKLIAVYNPMRQLTMGYSIIRVGNGKLVKSIKDVTIGDILHVTTSDGAITSNVQDVTEHTTHE